MKNLKRKLTINILIVCSFLFTGCGNTKFYSVSTNYQKSIKSNNETLLLLDSCIRSDNVGDDSDNWAVYKSKKVNEVLSSAVKETLEQKGFKINNILSPSMCGYFDIPSLNEKIQVRDKDELIVSNLPFALDDNIDQDLKNAIERVKNASYHAALDTTSFNEIFQKNPNINKDLELIKIKTGQNKILVINNSIIDVSTAKRLNVGLIHVLSLAFIPVSALSSMKTYVVLIDINNKEVLWRNAVIFKNPKIYDKDWYIGNSYNKSVLDSLGFKE